MTSFIHGRGHIRANDDSNTTDQDKTERPAAAGKESGLGASEGVYLRVYVYFWPGHAGLPMLYVHTKLYGGHSLPCSQPAGSTHSPFHASHQAHCLTRARARAPSLSWPFQILEPGDLDVAASRLVCLPTRVLNTSRPTKTGEAFLVEFNAMNSRNM